MIYYVNKLGLEETSKNQTWKDYLRVIQSRSTSVRQKSLIPGSVRSFCIPVHFFIGKSRILLCRLPFFLIDVFLDKENSFLMLWSECQKYCEVLDLHTKFTQLLNFTQLYWEFKVLLQHRIKQILGLQFMSAL